jgi:acetyltransferase-like isoleucine patch superfamily enzyme
MATFQVESSATVALSAVLADGVRIWHHAQVREGAQLGENVIVGKGAYIGPDVVIGKNCKIQNSALLYEPARLGDGVFIGPGVILTNDRYPRAINADLTQKNADDWNPIGVRIDKGASIGAGSVVVAPVQLGAWSMVAAGSVVVKNVPAHALVVGNPARQIGWVGKMGIRLIQESDSSYLCPVSKERYSLDNSQLREVR